MTAIGGPLTQVEAAALREALHTVRAGGVAEPTLPQIATVLFEPAAEMAAAAAHDPRAARAPTSAAPRSRSRICARVR